MPGIQNQFAAFACLCLLFSLVVSSRPGVAAEDDYSQMTDAKLNRLIEILEPSPYELWRKVPWKISLLQGQKLAVEQNKPIFIWAMDGHPLGCT